MPTVAQLVKWTGAHWELSAVLVPADRMAQFETWLYGFWQKPGSFAVASRWVK